MACQTGKSNRHTRQEESEQYAWGNGGGEERQ